MKTEAFLVVRERDSGPDVVADLGAIYPRGLDGDKFECRLPWRGDLIIQIMDCLSSYGLSPRSRGHRVGGKFYYFGIERIYSRLDIDESPYLTFSAKALVLGQNRADDGTIEIKSEELRSGADIASSTNPWFIVSDRLRKLLEGGLLEHVSFRETRILDSGGRPIHGGNKCYWELASDLILPPLGQPCKFIDARTEAEVSGDFDGPFVLRESIDPPELHIGPPEMHYDERVLRGVTPFDLGLTCERFVGGYLGGLPVCSQRFYRFCVANKINRKLDWTPVRINPA